MIPPLVYGSTAAEKGLISGEFYSILFYKKREARRPPKTSLSLQGLELGHGSVTQTKQVHEVTLSLRLCYWSVNHAVAALDRLVVGYGANI